MVFRDTNSELVRQCYHGNVSVGQNPELGEEQEVEESRTATWRDLPNVYLKLSKSRLTGVSACVLIGVYLKLYHSPPPPINPHSLTIPTHSQPWWL